jgi:hypothetical protein
MAKNCYGPRPGETWVLVTWLITCRVLLAISERQNGNSFPIQSLFITSRRQACALVSIGRPPCGNHLGGRKGLRLLVYRLMWGAGAYSCSRELRVRLTSKNPVPHAYARRNVRLLDGKASKRRSPYKALRPRSQTFKLPRRGHFLVARSPKKHRS